MYLESAGGGYGISMVTPFIKFFCDLLLNKHCREYANKQTFFLIFFLSLAFKECHACLSYCNIWT